MMELEKIILSEVSQVQKAKVAYLLSYVEYRPTTNKRVSYIHINIYRTGTPKVGQVKETKGGGKEGKKNSE
jgi:hypothetical protein